MAIYHYVILSAALPGREQEFARWYDEQHLSDVLRIEGVKTARRYNALSQKVTGIAGIFWNSVAIYEIESDDPQSVVEAISSAANTPEMPVTSAMDKNGLVQLLVEKSAESTQTDC